MTRRRAAAAAAALLALASASPAAAMDVATFLNKASALKARGMMALFSPDLRLLRHEADLTVAQISADKKARAAAGKPPLFCAADSERMSQSEMLAGLRAIPPAERGTSLKDGFLRVIEKRYPCR